MCSLQKLQQSGRACGVDLAFLRGDCQTLPAPTFSPACTTRHRRSHSAACPRAAAIAAKMNFTDMDLARFATNVECLEGLFDTWGTFGHGFIENLELGGPEPIGARQAPLTEGTRPFLQQIALNEQVRKLTQLVNCSPGVTTRPPCPRPRGCSGRGGHCAE